MCVTTRMLSHISTGFTFSPELNDTDSLVSHIWDFVVLSSLYFDRLQSVWSGEANTRRMNCTFEAFEPNLELAVETKQRLYLLRPLQLQRGTLTAIFSLSTLIISPSSFSWLSSSPLRSSSHHYHLHHQSSVFQLFRMNDGQLHHIRSHQLRLRSKEQWWS